MGEVVGRAAVRCRDGGCELQRTITEWRKDLLVWVPNVHGSHMIVGGHFIDGGKGGF